MIYQGQEYVQKNFVNVGFNMADYYLWIKAFHLMAVIAWMAGLFYLPRIFAYHADVEFGSDTDKIFQKMERRLLRIIMNPAMILTYILGFMLIDILGIKNLGMWFHWKFTLVLLMTALHGFMAYWRKKFVAGNNSHSNRFYRIVNEVPTILMIIIVILVIVRP
jgi:putative membrane protein